MTIEARNITLGIPLSIRDISYDRDEFMLRHEKLIDNNLHTIVITYTCRVISPDEIAVYQHTPKTPPYSKEHIRSAPRILLRDEINKAKLHTNGILFKTDLRWKPTR